MTKKHNIQSLGSIKGLAKKIKNNPAKSEYWKREEEIIIKRIEKRTEVYKMIEMDSKKYHTSFSL